MTTSSRAKLRQDAGGEIFNCTGNFPTFARAGRLPMASIADMCDGTPIAQLAVRGACSHAITRFDDWRCHGTSPDRRR